MATIAPAYDYTKGDDTVVVTWAAVTQADTFGPAGGGRFTDHADRCVQIYGTFGAATIVVNGSNVADASNMLPLTDPQGNAISKTTAAIEAITENALFIQPTHSGGAGESINVVLIARRMRTGK